MQKDIGTSTDSEIIPKNRNTCANQCCQFRFAVNQPRESRIIQDQRWKCVPLKRKKSLHTEPDALRLCLPMRFDIAAPPD